MDRTSLNVDKVLDRAWLYADPASFRAGVLAAADAFATVPEVEPARESLSLDRDDLIACPECQIPFDEDEVHTPSPPPSSPPRSELSETSCVNTTGFANCRPSGSK